MFTLLHCSQKSISGGFCNPMTEASFSSHIVSSVEDFRSVFAPRRGDQLLLCYEPLPDTVSPSDLSALESAAASAAAQHGTRVELHLWDCSGDAFAAARAQIEKSPGALLLLVVHNGTVADTLRGALASLCADLPRVCARLASHAQRAGAVAAQKDTTLSVDVAQCFECGRRLMASGHAGYAAKCFARAVASLDAVAPDCAGDADVAGSTALCLAWETMAHMAEGRGTNAKDAMQRLRKEFAAQCDVPRSDAAQACALHRMISALPRQWDGMSCSQRKLREALEADPRDDDSRCALVVTLFFAGDMERCLTEAVKLRALDVSFGATAIAAVSAFLGPDDSLVAQLSN